MLKKIIAAFFVCTLVACGPLPPEEEEPPPQPPPPQEYSETEFSDAGLEISDRELIVFAEVNREIEAMSKSGKETISLEKILDGTELSEERYNSIQVAVYQNPDLQQEVKQFFNH